MDLAIRPRRLRQSPWVRNLVSDVSLTTEQFIQPYFLKTTPGESEAITGFTGISRWSVDGLSRQIELDVESGLKNFLLFGYSETRDEKGSLAASENSIVPEALRALKKRFGDAATLFSDVCLCSYTSHGHCGIPNETGIDNDSSVKQLAEAALCHAQAGADFVAPSDMMDGRVSAIRKKLDRTGFSETGILAYTAKYSSHYYGPFREALGSSPKQGNRKTYQMDFRRKKEALQELALDVSEGADMVMVKPALAYLDVIQDFAQHSPVPVVAYSVSGEYELVKQMAKAGMANETELALENLYAIKRAGATVIITYFASEFSRQRLLS